MSRLAILNATIDNQLKIADIETAEEAGAVLTLTRTAVQAITTAGTTIVWQSEIRGYQITWSGASITIPATGWYAMDISLRFSAAVNNAVVNISANGVNVGAYNLIGDVDRQGNRVSMMRHFAESDTLQIVVTPSANVNIEANAENTTFESPILNIVQLSGEVDV
jgi:hypothetical protein